MRASWGLAAAALFCLAPGQEPAEAPAELLEFLGSFETAEGEWLDPLELEAPEAPPSDERSESGEDNDA